MLSFDAPHSRKYAAPAIAPKPARDEADVSPLKCAACGHVITHGSSRLEVECRHVHFRLNPHAFAFIFGCFSSAPGCLVQGVPTEEATWFSGYRWQFAHCAQCLVHLGWAFTGAQAFSALLLERLVDERP